MTEHPPLDAELMRSWIGRTTSASDVITPRLAEELRVTLDRDGPPPRAGDPCPLAIHWCLAPPMVPQSRLGPDGHPARGDFLPPVPLPRRMWAAGRLEFFDALRVGDAVERHSKIGDVNVKEGRSGRLCFVAVDHELSTPRGLALKERHDIVYRDAPSADAKPSAPVGEEAPRKAQWSETKVADAVMLFRYSALTFNGHRIHYDRQYVTEVEGYPGLIVHGPLQATLLIEYAATIRGAGPKTFSFRALNPLFDGQQFTLNAAESAGGLDLWIAGPGGRATMAAKAEW
ncbi:MAG: MaoC family dehydratase N-terminal domain-containing protein [Methylobacteriaceae bacterium]|nr:MaoC family dehydratase N-terminal domain-containing protein [Methylobacteriaceae bacterium]